MRCFLAEKKPVLIRTVSSLVSANRPHLERYSNGVQAASRRSGSNVVFAPQHTWRPLPLWTMHDTERKCTENYNKGHNKFIFKLQSAFWLFQTITVSKCCLIKLLPLFIWKMYLNFSTWNGQPWERALCQLYWHTFVPYWLCHSHRVRYTRWMSPTVRPIAMSSDILRWTSTIVV